MKHSDILKKNDNSRPILITLIAIALIVLIGVGVYASGIFTPDVPLTTKDFGAFKIDVPEGSDFVVKDSVTTSDDNLFISYENKGKYSNELTYILVGNNMDDDDDDSEVKLIETDGNMKVYQYIESDATGKCCIAFVDDGNCQVETIGYDLNTVKRVAKSFKAVDISKLKNNVTPLNEITPTATAQTSTPSSISILGGSFSTGSADSDKTYAKINVGKSHAGESIIVQIFYSRDGKNLNDGNMVPVTVHSDGYVELTSADAYKYYPDHATIKIYDSNSRLLTTKNVSLKPAAGTQTF